MHKSALPYITILRTSEGNVNILVKLKQIINVGHALSP